MHFWIYLDTMILLEARKASLGAELQNLRPEKENVFELKLFKHITRSGV